jgi:hypothetical protein
MKTNMIIAIMLLFIMVSCSITKTTPEASILITKKIESKNFTIEVNYANPLRMLPVYLNSNYTLRIKNDSAFAYLPYYGVIHVAPFDAREGGIKFETLMNEYKVLSNRMNSGWDIRFKVKPAMYEYSVHMKVYKDGKATVSFNSYQQDPISFNGEVRP